MKINKFVRQDIKNKYPKYIYNFFIKLHSINALEFIDTDLYDFLDMLGKYEKNDLDMILKVYKINQLLAINLILVNFKFNNIDKYFNIFGEKLLITNTNDIISLNIEHPNIIPLLPFIKNNYNFFNKVILNKNNIMTYGKFDISSKVISNHFDNYIDFVNNGYLFGTNLKTIDINTLCELSRDDFNKFYKLLEELNSSSSLLSYEYKNVILYFLIYNSNYLDLFLLEFKKDNYKFNIIEYIKSYNGDLVNSFIYTLLKYDKNFYLQKDILRQLLYDKIDIHLNDMLIKRNNNITNYNEELNNYLDCYLKWKNSNNVDDLVKFYDYYNQYNNINYNKINEFIIIEYNKYFNSLLTNINFDKNVDLKEEDYFSKKYDKNGKIKIYTLHDVPFVYLGHSIVKGKYDELNKFDKRNKFILDLHSNPHLWNSRPKHGTNYISMSLGNDLAIRNFGVPEIIICFNNLHDHQIKYTKCGDAATSMEPETFVDNTLDLISPENLLFPNADFGQNKRFIYNEIISDRENILPSYLLTASKPNFAGIPVLNDNIREWALYFDIPIYNLDCDSYFKSKYNLFINYLNELINKEEFPSVDDLCKLSSLQTSAYQYTTEEPEDLLSLIRKIINSNKSISNNEEIISLNTIIYLLKVGGFIKNKEDNEYILYLEEFVFNNKNILKK